MEKHNILKMIIHFNLGIKFFKIILWLFDVYFIY